MVEVLLVEVEEDGDMRGIVGVLQLVCRQFGYDGGAVVDLLQDVEKRCADIAGQQGVADRVGEDMVDERGGGAFPLRAGDSDNILAVGHQKKLRLRHKFLSGNEVVEVVEVDTGRFEDDIVLVEVTVVLFARHNFQVFVFQKIIGMQQRIFVCHRDGQVGIVLADKFLGRHSLASESHDDDFFAFEKLDDLVFFHA